MEESDISARSADEEIEISVFIDIGKCWVGVTTRRPLSLFRINIRYSKWFVSTFLGISGSRCKSAQASGGPGGVGGGLNSNVNSIDVENALVVFSINRGFKIFTAQQG
ncbi:hypothetical protein MITS9509_01285 [Synechococcus sp. MIT S9509]|nr:hypothetical protein MITS9504_00850 [Synechococcus sp. MIT S9504]KZR92835.1 hypothetical protein MITS9509_01285 [Synechococcus sp. MIT S9509]